MTDYRKTGLAAILLAEFDYSCKPILNLPCERIGRGWVARRGDTGTMYGPAAQEWALHYLELLGADFYHPERDTVFTLSQFEAFFGGQVIAEGMPGHNSDSRAMASRLMFALLNLREPFGNRRQWIADTPEALRFVNSGNFPTTPPTGRPPYLDF